MQRRSFLILAGVAGVECVAGEPVKALAMEIHSYEDAARLARDSGRRLYVLFVGNRCKWCDLQKEVMTHRRVVEGLKSFFVTYVNVTENKDIARAHNVRAVPTHLILEGEEVIKKFAGYQTVDEFLNWLC